MTAGPPESLRVTLGRRGPAGRIGIEPAEIQAFSGCLRADDTITFEATGNALAIVRILESHVRVVTTPR